MSSGVVIRDHQSLEELQEAQRYTSDSVMKIVAHVSDYLDSQIQAMEEQKKVLEEQVEEAKERYDAAESAYSSCLNSQTYDEEDQSYHPSCASEGAEVDRCREEYDELKRRDEEAKKVLDSCKDELRKYREPGGAVTPPGGESLMKYLAKEHTDKANEKMDRIRECVKKYLSTPCSIRSASLGRSAEQQQQYEEGVAQMQERHAEAARTASEKKAAAFRTATASVQEEMSRRGYRPAMAVAVCPGCKRPVNVCICQHILERSR